MKTATEIVEFVYDKLMIQGKRSYGQFPQSTTPHTTCLYRGPGGTKCAVGWLIPDEVYDKYCEGSVPRDDRIIRMLAANDIDGKEHSNLLTRLQRAHDLCRDGVRFRSDLHEAFVKICRDFEIDIELKDPSTYEV